jgi:hypothetical protein
MPQSGAEMLAPSPPEHPEIEPIGADFGIEDGFTLS